MKKAIVLISCLLINFPLLSFLDLYPWLVIQNNSNADLICEIEIHVTAANLEFKSNINNPTASAKCRMDEDDNFVIIELFIEITAHKEIVINPILHVENKAFNPTINSIKFTNNNLQTTAIVAIDNKDKRYITINYEENIGITTYAKEIPSSIKYCNACKSCLQSIILTMLEATKSMPY